jgi:hypothetical protein
MKLGKLLAIAGLTYVVESVVRGVAKAPHMAAFLTGIGVILILLFGLFDWTYYDDVIRSALALIGLLYFAGIAALLMEGQVGAALAAVVCLLIVTGLFQPVVSGFLARWDTPERQFTERMEQACGYDYIYSPQDGYCHFNHQDHDDLLETSNPNGHGYVEVKVPPNWHNTGSAEGALENIQRLKEQAAAVALAPPTGSSSWVWWIAVPAAVWWTVGKFFGDKPTADSEIERQIARYRRPGFRDPRQHEIERRMRNYLSGHTTKF